MALAGALGGSAPHADAGLGGMMASVPTSLLLFNVMLDMVDLDHLLTSLGPKRKRNAPTAMAEIDQAGADEA